MTPGAANTGKVSKRDFLTGCLAFLRSVWLPCVKLMMEECIHWSLEAL